MAGPFLDFVGVKAGDRVLDVGCCTGVITAALAERGRTVVGLDASEPYLEGARRDRSHPNIVYQLGDARRMPHADASFDACVSALAMDVIPEVDQVVREMRRVTRGGGTVASSVFDFWGGFSPRRPCVRQIEQRFLRVAAEPPTRPTPPARRIVSAAPSGTSSKPFSK